jgi:hypothetical protein
MMMTDTTLVIPQGTDPEIRIPNVRDANGVLITNWAGFSVKAHIRDRVESTTVLYEWTSQGATPNVTFDGSDVVLSLPHATSTAWTWTHARFDVELTDPSGRVARIAEGRIVVDREVTR